MGLLYAPIYTALDTSGAPISGALLYSYASQTTTPMAVFSDAAMQVAHTNPVVADAFGRFPAIYMSDNVAYKLVITDAVGVTLHTLDPVSQDGSVEEKATDEITHDGVTATYTLSATPLNEQSLDVYTDGAHNTAWTLDGDQLTFNPIPSDQAKSVVRISSNMTGADLVQFVSDAESAKDIAVAAKDEINAYGGMPINTLVEATTVDQNIDFLYFYDASVGEHRKVKPQNIGIDTVDNLARGIGMTAFIMADVASDPAGQYGPILTYDFSTDNLETSTNATYTNGSYSNIPNALIDQATGAPIGDMTQQGGLSAAFDGTDLPAQSGAATAFSAVGHVGKDWGVGNSKTIDRYVAYSTSDYGWSGGGDGTITLRLQGSHDGLTWTTLHTKEVTDTNGSVVDVSDGIDTSTAYRYHRLEIDAPAANVACGELYFYETAVPLDMELAPYAVTLSSPNPADVVAYFTANDASLAVEGVDRTVEISLNNGVDWVLATPQEDSNGNVVTYKYGDDLIIVYEADTTGLSGDQLVWRIKTFNSKGQDFKRANIAFSY